MNFVLDRSLIEFNSLYIPWIVVPTYMLPITSHPPDMSSNETAPPPPDYMREPSRQLDTLLLFTYLLNIIIGVPGNISAFRFFRTQKADLPSLLYRVTTVTDLCILLHTVPTIISLFMEREPVLFEYTWFCTILGCLQTVLPAFSVSIVAVLCTSRTVQLFCLVRKPNKIGIFVGLFLYLTYLVLAEFVPVFMGTFRFLYWPTEIYCW